MNELALSHDLVILVRETYADLEVQAMLFDMDIDIETWSLTPKSDYKEPFWLTNWKNKEKYGKDLDNRFDFDAE